MSDDKKRIIVRDRREVHQFSVHNRIIDEWLPIIDKHGYAIYSLYVRMANKVDERSWPGYTLIEQHLGIGATTISNYNRLLVWCKLIHIEHGDKKTPNEYYILNVPTCTPEVIQDIREKATAHFTTRKNTFLPALLKRLKKWRPIQEYWRKDKKKLTVVHPSQLSLPTAQNPTPPGGVPYSPGKSTLPPGEEQGTPPGKVPHSSEGNTLLPGEEQGTPPGGQEQSKTTIQNNNPKQQSKTTSATPPTTPPAQDDAVVVALTQLLSKFGIQEPTLSQLTNDDITIADAQAWIQYAESQDSITDPPAFVIAKLRQHAAAPPIKTKPGRKPPAEEVDAETRARQKAALAKLKRRQQRRRQIPTVEDMPDLPVPDKLLPPPN